MAAESPAANADDYSPSATIIPFDRPVPLLRGPIKSGSDDDPESGQFLLVFKDPKSWALAYKECESQIIQQCEVGARIGCSINASNNCKPPWWKLMLGYAKQDYKEREECEEREMKACFEKAKEKCGEVAEQKCLKAFKDSRISVKGLDLIQNRKEVSKLISWVCLESKSRMIYDTLKPGNSWNEFRRRFEVTNCRGSDLLGLNGAKNFDYYLESSTKTRETNFSRKL